MSVPFYVADFETRLTIPVSVWLWAIVDENEVARYGNDINGFFEILENAGENINIFFHNLKFDGSYIIVEANKRGYYLTDKRGDVDPERPTLYYIISDAGQWYMIQISYNYTRRGKDGKSKGKRRRTIKIYDSLKRIKGSVAEIAVSYGVGTVKGDCDYSAPRPIGYQPTAEEVNYCVTDCVIILRALQQVFETNENFKKKMTVASASLATYKQTIGEMRFKDFFPLLPDPMDAAIRKAYRGGYTYLKPKFCMTEQPSYVYDINSMYPYIMVSRLLPWGYPQYFRGQPIDDKNFPLWVAHITAYFDIKPDKLPTIQLKHSGFFFNPTDYLTDSGGESVDLYITNVDFDVISDCYNLRGVEWVDGYRFRATKGMFTEYIDMWMKVKQTSKGAKRQTAKTLLNSLYGKTGASPTREHKIIHVENDTLKFTRSKPEESDTVYIPAAVFITSYAREYIQKEMMKHPEAMYCDTDSIHCCAPVSEIEIDPVKLGAWKLEGEFFRSKFIRAKCYVEEDEKGEHYTVAGATDKVKQNMTFDAFEVGNEFDGKLTQTQVPGGALLVPTTFSIKDFSTKKRRNSL